MSTLTDRLDTIERAGDAYAVAEVARRLGVAGAEALQVEIERWAAGLEAPAPNPPIGGAVSRMRASAVRALRSVRVDPASILAFGGALGVYSWMSASERVEIESINARLAVVDRAVDACAGDPQCLRQIAAAAADGARSLADVTGGGLGVTLAIVAALGLGFVLLWRR